MIKANDVTRKSWVEISKESDFPIQNIPFGIISYDGYAPRVASRLGDMAVDLLRVNELGFFADLNIPSETFNQDALNQFMALGRTTVRAVRDRIAELFDAAIDKWNTRAHSTELLIPLSKVNVLLPVKVGDYTDFYSSIEHATNVGIMFRDPANALLPNWRHIPIGYHGRSSSIVPSGTPIQRPSGQTRPDAEQPPIFGPSKLLDFELEMAFYMGKGNTLGTGIPIDQAEDHIFGLSLFNDWSARDIQKWEYIPLGPFLGKSFASTVSSWVVTLDALEPFRVKGPEQDPKVLPYLQYSGKGNFDIHLEVYIQPKGEEPFQVSKSNYKYMYWNMAQQIAHHSVNGCNLQLGDLYGSGTISGKDASSYGSMLEISWKGTKPVQLPNGESRKFLQDGDTVILKGYGEKDGIRIGFGEASGKIVTPESIA